MSIDWPDWTAGNVTVVEAAGAVTGATVKTSTVEVVSGIATEVLVMTTDALTVQTDPALALVLVWWQQTKNVALANVTPRVRRGTLLTDPVVGEANAWAGQTALAIISDSWMQVSEFLLGTSSVRYTFSLQPAAETVTVNQVTMAVVLF